MLLKALLFQETTRHLRLKLIQREIIRFLNRKQLTKPAIRSQNLPIHPHHKNRFLRRIIRRTQLSSKIRQLLL